MATSQKKFHSLTPYLFVDGAAKAIEFYQKVFNAEVLDRHEKDGKIMHAEIKVGDSLFMLADEFPEWNVYGPNHFKGSPIMLYLYVDDVDAAFKKALAASAKEVRPVEDQFYGDRAGVFTDPFGHVWNVATHVEDVSDEEVRRRAKELNNHK